ncbi:MAG TPA: hypothetical protein VKQ34_01010 [Candidatus Saccharimonadales bacterium]|nr:hypothetical protein [Candidatus Saccharimonadales bacterium]
MSVLRVTFDQALRDFVLDAFDKKVDESGYLVEKSNPEQRVLSKDGQQIPKEKFAGIRKGSEIYIKSDLLSLIELCEDLKSRG